LTPQYNLSIAEIGV